MKSRSTLLFLGHLFLAFNLSGQQQVAHTHMLKATTKTVAWGYYDAKTEPVLRVKSGDTVAVQTLMTSRPNTSFAQRSRDKNVWNYDGGVSFATDGSLPNGVCFRVSGGLDAPEFFVNLKRINDERGTVFLRGAETVRHFPDELTLSFDIRDQPCTPGLREIEARTYLTPEMMSTLRLSFYWKRGMELRPVKHITEVRSSVEPIVPYAANLAADLPKRFEWSYQLSVPSKGVPLTDSLVLVFRTNDGRTPDGRIAARVAARL